MAAHCWIRICCMQRTNCVRFSRDAQCVCVCVCVTLATGIFCPLLQFYTSAWYWVTFWKRQKERKWSCQEWKYASSFGAAGNIWSRSSAADRVIMRFTERVLDKAAGINIITSLIIHPHILVDTSWMPHKVSPIIYECSSCFHFNFSQSTTRVRPRLGLLAQLLTAR